MPTMQLFVPAPPLGDGDLGSGRFVELDILNPWALISTLSLLDLCLMLGHGLAGTNRYGCHTPTRMSTAAHTALGAGWVFRHPDGGIPEDQNWFFARVPIWGAYDKVALALKFMIHDAAEGLGLCDIPTPYKQAIGLEVIEELEYTLCRAVACRLVYEIDGAGPAEFEPDHDGRIKTIDRSILVDETRALMPGPLGPHWDFLREHRALGLSSDQYIAWLNNGAEVDLHTQGWAWAMMLHGLVRRLGRIRRIESSGTAQSPACSSDLGPLTDEDCGIDPEQLPAHLGCRVWSLLRSALG